MAERGTITASPRIPPSTPLRSTRSAVRVRTWGGAAAVLLVPVGLIALYLWVVLSWAYSDGERAGILQKFSRKGWLCKTFEGELAISIVPGVTPV